MFQSLVGVVAGTRPLDVVRDEAGDFLGAPQQGLVRVRKRARAGPRQYVQGAHAPNLIGRRPAQKGGDGLDRVAAELGVGSHEADAASFGQVAVVGAHPLDEVDHLPGAPGPEAQPGDEPLGGTRAVPDVRVERAGGGLAGLHGEDGEPLLTDQEFYDAVLQPEELARPVGGFPQTDDPCPPQRLAQGLQVLHRRAGGQGAQGVCVLVQPSGDLVGHRLAFPHHVRDGGTQSRPGLPPPFMGQFVASRQAARISGGPVRRPVGSVRNTLPRRRRQHRPPPPGPRPARARGASAHRPPCADFYSQSRFLKITYRLVHTTAISRIAKG